METPRRCCKHENFLQSDFWVKPPQLNKVLFPSHFLFRKVFLLSNEKNRTEFAFPSAFQWVFVRFGSLKKTKTDRGVSLRQQLTRHPASSPDPRRPSEELPAWLLVAFFVGSKKGRLARLPGFLEKDFTLERRCELFEPTSHSYITTPFCKILLSYLSKPITRKQLPTLIHVVQRPSSPNCKQHSRLARGQQGLRVDLLG